MERDISIGLGQVLRRISEHMKLVKLSGTKRECLQDKLNEFQTNRMNKEV